MIGEGANRPDVRPNLIAHIALHRGRGNAFCVGENHPQVLQLNLTHYDWPSHGHVRDPNVGIAPARSSLASQSWDPIHLRRWRKARLSLWEQRRNDMFCVHRSPHFSIFTCCHDALATQ